STVSQGTDINAVPNIRELVMSGHGFGQPSTRDSREILGDQKCTGLVPETEFHRIQPVVIDCPPCLPKSFPKRTVQWTELVDHFHTLVIKACSGTTADTRQLNGQEPQLDAFAGLQLIGPTDDMGPLLGQSGLDLKVEPGQPEIVLLGIGPHPHL